MTSPYPPQPPRRLERRTSNKVIAGVCSGLANYLNMDPTLVRVLSVALTLFTGGLPVILYIVAMFVMPEEGSRSRSGPYPPVGPPQVHPGQDYGQQSYGQGYFPSNATPPVQQPAYRAGAQDGAPAQPYTPAASAPASADDAVWGTEGAPWEQRLTEPAPATPSSPSPEPAAARAGSDQPQHSPLDDSDESPRVASSAEAQQENGAKAPAPDEPADEGAKVEDSAVSPAAKLPGEGPGFDPRS